MPFLTAARSVTAMTTAVSAMPPLVMKFFDPFRTQWPPSLTAVVRMPPASEPEPGSVSPQQPTFSPRARGGRKRRFCSALPPRWMWAEQRLWWAARESATPASTRASSSITIAQSRVERPDPPYSSGQQQPASPSPPSLENTSRGNSCFSSHSREWGRSSFSAKPRTVRRSSDCSALSSKSMGSWYTASCHAPPRPAPLRPAPRSRRRGRPRRARRLGVGGPARPLRGEGAPPDEPGEDAPDGAARGGGEGEGAQGEGLAVLGPALARLAPPHPRRPLLGGPGLLRARGRRLEGHRGVDREERGEGPLRAGRQHDHAAARQEPVLRHAQDARAQGARAGGDAVAGGGPPEGPHPRALPQPDRVGRRDLRVRGRPRATGTGSPPRRSRPARRPGSPP